MTGGGGTARGILEKKGIKIAIRLKGLGGGYSPKLTRYKGTKA
jgi:hypothetical protein